jgi:lipoprotein NlpI
MRHIAAAVAVALATVPPPAAAQAPQDIADRAELDFAEGRVAESVAGYDRLAALVPSAAPSLWQRGIGLYILGRYEDCAKQFLSFYKEAPNDLENAAWHFLCVARVHSIERARATMLDAGPDARILRQQIHEMLGGDRTPASLLELVRVSIPVAQFYAHLYVGLFCDASGDRAGAVEHLTAAASDRYRGQGGFMNVVARVYAARLSSK